MVASKDARLNLQGPSSVSILIIAMICLEKPKSGRSETGKVYDHEN